MCFWNVTPVIRACNGAFLFHQVRNTWFVNIVFLRSVYFFIHFLNLGVSKTISTFYCYFLNVFYFNLCQWLNLDDTTYSIRNQDFLIKIKKISLPVSPVLVFKSLIDTAKALVPASPPHIQGIGSGWNNWNSEAQALLREALQRKTEKELWDLQADLPLRNGQENCLHLQDEQTGPLAWLLAKCAVMIQCVMWTAYDWKNGISNKINPPSFSHQMDSLHPDISKELNTGNICLAASSSQ